MMDGSQPPSAHHKSDSKLTINMVHLHFFFVMIYDLSHKKTKKITLLHHERSLNNCLPHRPCLLDWCSNYCHSWTDLTTSQNLKKEFADHLTHW